MKEIASKSDTLKLIANRGCARTGAREASPGGEIESGQSEPLHHAGHSVGGQSYNGIHRCQLAIILRRSSLDRYVLLFVPLKESRQVLLRSVVYPRHG